MATKSEEQKIDDLTKEIKRLEDKKKQLEFRTRERARKERTRRLIQIGAIMDSMGIDNLEIAEKFKNYFISTPKSKEWLDKFIANDLNLNEEKI